MEISIEEARKILRNCGIEYSSKNNLSQLGGLKAMLEILKRGRFSERLTDLFGPHKARTILQTVVGLWAGARTMVEVGQAGKDPLVKKFIPSAVEEAQLGRDFRSFTKHEIESLHDFNVSQTIFDLVQKTPTKETLYFDIDATSVEKYGSQEGVEKGYVGKDDPESCYQYLLIYFNNRKTFLYGTVRGGSAHSQNDFCGYLQRFLPMLEHRWSTVFRADSGYHNEKAFDLFSQYSATFFIKSPMLVSRQNFIQTSPGLVWSHDQGAGSYCSYVTNTEAGTKFREIYKRTRLDKGGQLSLGEVSEYRYDCLSTNDFVAPESVAFEIYNKRAHIENAIKELKEDYQLGRIVTDSFDANDVITQVTMLAYMLVQVLKNEVLPPKMSRMRLCTLRTQVFNVPGCLVHWARREITRIQNIFIPETIMAMIMKKARSFTSWVLDPPMMELAA
jgi:hypothetical protein